MSNRFVQILRGWLANQHVPIVLAVLAIVVMLPAVRHGWFLDDMMFRARLLESSGIDEQLGQDSGLFRRMDSLSEVMSGLYAFIGHRESVEEVMNYGVVPWWTDPDCRISFWRPVTSFSIWFDYQLFPNSGALQHLHSILWFGGAIFVLTVLYRRLTGTIWIAGLAGLLYALDESNYVPVAFIANRNAVLALFFGLLAVLMHDKWRRERFVGGAILSCVFMALSLLSAEGGIATMAYLAAYAFTLDRGGWARRIASLLPAAAVIVVWRVVHTALGYATYASGIYIDPGSEPLRFAKAVLERAPVLLCGQLGGPFSEAYYFFSYSARVKVLLVVIGLLLLLLVVLMPLLRKDRAARFWLLGMLFAVVPICATMASNRNLLFVGVGAMGLVAQFIGGMLSQEEWSIQRRLWRAPAWMFCFMLLFFHVVWAGGGRVVAPWVYSKWTAATEATFDIELPGEAQKHNIVAVNASLPLFLVGLPAKSALDGFGVPKSVRALAPAFSPLEITRTEDKVLEVKALTGSLLFCEKPEGHWLHFVFFLQDFNTIFRDVAKRFTSGDRVELRGVTVEVKEIDRHGWPTMVAFWFDASLDDAAFRWVKWEWTSGGRYVPFDMPAVGESVEIAGVPW